MNKKLQLVIFTLDSRKYALHLSVVTRVVHAVGVTPLPGSPDAVLGAITIEGTVLPVYDVRKRFSLEKKEISPNDHFLIAHARAFPVVLIVDEVLGTVECDAQDSRTEKSSLPENRYADGIITLEGNIVYIHDIDSFLSLDEERTLKKALRK